MKRLLRFLIDLFTDTAADYWEWTWDTPEEREAFIKYFRFCHQPQTGTRKETLA